MGEPNDMGTPLEKSTAVRGRERLPLRLARGALRLYPAAWRERYAEEMLHVLQQHRVTVWTVLDVLVGAFDAHLHPNLLPERVTSMAYRIRTSEIMVFCAFVLFGLCWLSVNFVRDPLPPWEEATRLHPELLTALTIEQAAGGVAFLALLAGGLPILFSIVRQAIAGRRWSVLLWLCVPPIAFALLIGYGLLTVSASTVRQSSAPNAPLTPLAFILQLSLLLLFVIAVILSVYAIARAVNRSTLDTRLLRLMLWPAAIITLAIGVGLAATIALTAFSYVDAPQLGPGNLAAVAVVMGIATVLAVFALRRGVAAARYAR
jgi:hypothetical protein